MRVRNFDADCVLQLVDTGQAGYGTPDFHATGLGHTTQDISASELIWDFCSAHKP